MSKRDEDERPLNQVRRRSTPLEAQQMWDAVSYWTSDVLRQQATAERINTFLGNRYDIFAKQGAGMLQRCLEDRLLVKDVRTAIRGKNVGKEVVTYAVPEKMERDGWDWYCFGCHKCEGAVMGCVSCFRVYHSDCLPVLHRSDAADFKCPLCQEIEAELASRSYDLETLNKCIGYVIERIKFCVPENVFARQVPVAKYSQKDGTVAAEDEPFREALLLFKPASVARMEAKCKASQYRCTSELVGDGRDILHNAHIFHDDDGGAPLLMLAQMLRAIELDATVIKNCMQCFINSNELPKDWFCIPCHPPHLLVYAKQKGYCYWPAKVIRSLSNGKRVTFDVRFFGPRYERASIEVDFIKPIDTPAARLGLKKSAKLDTALRELATHIKLLEERDAAAAPKEEAPKPSQGASHSKKRLKTDH